MAQLTLVIAAAAVVLASLAGYNAVVAVLGIAERSRYESDVRRRVAEAGSSAGSASSITVIAWEPGDDYLGRFLRGRIGGRVLRLVRAAGLSMTPDVFVKRVMMASVSGLVLGWLFSGSLVPGVVLAIAAIVVPYQWLVTRGEKRVNQMRGQLPDAFTLIGNSVGSGLSLQQALEYAARETPEPLGPDLWLLVNDVNGGMSLSEALERLKTRVPLRELQTVATAMEVQRRSGGSMRDMLDQATEIIRTSLELRLMLQAQTAQGKLSARVVGLLPLGLVGVIALISRDFVAPFFDSSKPIGPVIFTVAVVMDVVGFILVKKIVEIEI